MEVISAYTRKEALEDGVLVDASKLAAEAGFRFPVALTRAVWERYVTVPEAVPWQDETGRLWDVLWMLRYAKSSGGESTLRFELLVQNDEHSPKVVELKSVCGPGDDAEPVITVMLPEED
jgi:hypothetical protein